MCERKKKITTVEAAELLGVKDWRLRSIFSGLTKRGILEKSGVTKNTVYLQGGYLSPNEYEQEYLQKLEKVVCKIGCF